MSNRPTVTLRLEPHMLPGLVVAYGRAADEMRLLVADVKNQGRIEQPWTSDPVSVAMAEHYNDVVMDGAHSTYAALRQYMQELVDIRDTLKAMEADCRRTEGENAELWGRA